MSIFNFKGRTFTLTEIKYLRVILDSTLTFQLHVDKITDKGTIFLCTGRCMFGVKWSLPPNVTQLSGMHANGGLEATHREKLRKLQRLVCLGITGTTAYCGC